mmetsp:Transcript_23199/g.55515  ORF Transcript_23199/g.55515 Transcript_23199/m.55515 type:complete len:218 (+) Transcript_23199:3698-4351(+)
MAQWRFCLTASFRAAAISTGGARESLAAHSPGAFCSTSPSRWALPGAMQPRCLKWRRGRPTRRGGPPARTVLRQPAAPRARRHHRRLRRPSPGRQRGEPSPRGRRRHLGPRPLPPLGRMAIRSRSTAPRRWRASSIAGSGRANGSCGTSRSSARLLRGPRSCPDSGRPLPLSSRKPPSSTPRLKPRSASAALSSRRRRRRGAPRTREPPQSSGTCSR